MAKLRVWHIPQVTIPNTFFIDVSSVEEAWKILNIIWDYDLFQYRNNIKPDYCNASGLQYYDEEEKEWFEWCDEDCYDITEHYRFLEESEG